MPRRQAWFGLPFRRHPQYACRLNKKAPSLPRARPADSVNTLSHAMVRSRSLAKLDKLLPPTRQHKAPDASFLQLQMHRDHAAYCVGVMQHVAAGLPTEGKRSKSTA